MSTFSDVLSEYRQLLWPIIEKNILNSLHYPSFCRIDKKFQPEVDFHRQLIIEYPKRQGKYFRPSLLLLTAQSMGVSLELALQTAAAMQISEDWILNHDDIEDDSPTRRGQPALHKLFGTELALNAGDALHLVMWQTLFNNFPLLGNQKAIEILQEFQIMLNRTVLGQGVEIKWARDGRFDLTDLDNFFVLESKTGYYTIAGPMRLGAILAGATPDQLKKIYKFGVLLGRSFQIIDDYLDLTSDFGGTKQQFNDIYEGKRTIITSHLLRSVTATEKDTIKNILRKPRSQKTEAEIKEIVSLMTKYGCLDYAKGLANRFADESKKIFSRDLKFLKSEPYRQQLESAIDFIVNRTR